MNSSRREVSELPTGELIGHLIDSETQFPISSGFQIEAGISLRDLSDATLPELKEFLPDLGCAEFERLMAGIELGRRVFEAKQFVPDREKLNGSTKAIAFCENYFSRLATDGKQEEFHILTLDTKNRFINSHLISIGTLDASLVHPREVFRPAIRDSAASVIAVHNHPSGDATPSEEDKSVTKRLEQAGEMIGIDVLDHIVIAREGAVSVRELR